MRMFKFMLFVGFFLLCGLVGAENAYINIKDKGMPVYINDEGIPQLDVFLDLENIGCADNCHYDAQWNVTELSSDSQQAKSIMTTLMGTLGEKSTLSLSQKENIKNILTVSKDKEIINGGLKVFWIGLTSLCPSMEWPDASEPMKLYAIHYKIDQYISKKLEKTVADFTIILACYWNDKSAKSIEVLALGKYDNSWNVDITLGVENEENIRSIRSVISVPQKTSLPSNDSP